ncbi:hypothetical protein S83_070796 [Arachis hypogaea]
MGLDDTELAIATYLYSDLLMDNNEEDIVFSGVTTCRDVFRSLMSGKPIDSPVLLLVAYMMTTELKRESGYWFVPPCFAAIFLDKVLKNRSFYDSETTPNLISSQFEFEEAKGLPILKVGSNDEDVWPYWTWLDRSSVSARDRGLIGMGWGSSSNEAAATALGLRKAAKIEDDVVLGSRRGAEKGTGVRRGEREEEERKSGNENFSILVKDDVKTLIKTDASEIIDMIKSHCNNSIRGLSRKFKALSPVNQHAVALSLIEDGEVVLRVLGCPNYPMKKKWSSYPYSYLKIMSKLPPPTHESWNKRCVVYAKRGSGKAWKQSLLLHAHDKFVWPNHAKQVCFSSIEDPSLATFCEIVEKANKISHSFTQGLVDTVAIVHGNAEAFMKFAKESYKERIWDHAADIIIMQEAGGMVTDARGNLLNFSKELDIEGIDRGIVASCEATLHEKIIDAIDTNWTSSCL